MFIHFYVLFTRNDSYFELLFCKVNYAKEIEILLRMSQESRTISFFDENMYNNLPETIMRNQLVKQM